jgi:hypothetical protein
VTARGAVDDWRSLYDSTVEQVGNIEAIAPRRAGGSQMTKSSVVPTGAERSACPERSRREAERRDLFCWSDCTKRSLGCAARQLR